MTREELMLGDYVQVNGEACKVISISYFDIGISDSKEDFYQEHIDNIKPIPLTAEILKKNFPSTTDWYFIGTDKFCFRIDKYKDKWDLYFGRDGKGTNLQIKISYVHELQHILRLCGIDKEIEV